MKPIASIIIPTTANASRAPFLRRAIRSLLSGQGGLVLPLVVVNGSSYLPEFLDELRRWPDIRCLYIERAGTTGARLAARRVVDTEFFGMLDDDDEYLTGGIGSQVRPMLTDPSVDAVVANGYRCENGEDSLHYPAFSTFCRDPLSSLMEYAWLNPGSILCRTDRVPPSYLELPRSMELTYMAMKLALTRKLHFIDEPTYRWHRDVPEQLSRTKHYLEGAPDGIRRMMALNPPAHIKRSLAQKYAASLHFLSDWERADGDYRAAWRYHVKSILSPYGARYLTYSMHLVRFAPRT
ncbi:MAG TPA: glycosyltransferase family 2 protein [Candidatus Eisenbacteria bacterium]|nr:glycosyltransferase family 2 protein [Candidatus Eisenbacteria bacterium]